MKRKDYPDWLRAFLKHLDIDFSTFNDDFFLTKLDNNVCGKITSHINRYNNLRNYRTSARFAGHIEILEERGVPLDESWLSILSNVEKDDFFIACKEHYKSCVRQENVFGEEEYANKEYVLYMDIVFPNYRLYKTSYSKYISYSTDILTVEAIDEIAKATNQISIPGFFLPFLDDMLEDDASRKEANCNVFWYCMTKHVFPAICNFDNLVTGRINRAITLDIIKYYCSVLKNLFYHGRIVSTFSTMDFDLYANVMTNEVYEYSQDNIKYLTSPMNVFCEHYCNNYKILSVTRHHKNAANGLLEFYNRIKNYDEIEAYDKKTIITIVPTLYVLINELDESAQCFINHYDNMIMSSFLFWIPLARTALMLNKVEQLLLLNGIINNGLYKFGINENNVKTAIRDACEFIQNIYFSVNGHKGDFDELKDNLELDDKFYLLSEIFGKYPILELCEQYSDMKNSKFELRVRLINMYRLLLCFGCHHDHYIRIKNFHQIFEGTLSCSDGKWNSKLYLDRYDKLTRIYSNEQKIIYSQLLERYEVLTELEKNTRYGISFKQISGLINDRINGFAMTERSVEMSNDKILIMVATPLELETAIRALGEISAVRPIINHKLSYHELVIGTKTISIVKSQMGAGGVGGATLTAQDAIALLRPQFAIMGGIAFGGDKENQKIGDILISSKIWEYEPEKINEDGTIPRGAITPASPQLFQMFETISASVEEINIHTGLIASGEKLSNNKNFVLNKLKSREPELIGGDMEGAGFAATCQRYGVAWILVKGICDWGYEKDTETKKQDQKIAADNTFSLIREVISNLPE